MVNFVAQYSIYVITVVFMIICTFLTDKFLTASNLVNILRQVTVYAVLAFGQAILLISGNLDLCAGSTCCLTGILALKTYLATGSMAAAVAVGMLAGVVINTFSGFVIAQFNLPGFCRHTRYADGSPRYVLHCDRRIHDFSDRGKLEGAWTGICVWLNPDFGYCHAGCSPASVDSA